MSILDRKPKRYSTSDLFWEPSPAPSSGTVGDINTMRLDPSHLGMAQDVIIDSSGVLRSRGGFVTVTADTFTTLVPGGGMSSSTGTVLISKNSSNETLIQGTANANLTSFVTLTGTSPGGSTTVDAMTNQPGTATFAKLNDNKGGLIALDYGFISTTLSATSIWAGNVTTTSRTITGTAASTIGTKAVAGVGTAWTSALEGCYLFIGTIPAATYVGVVDQVTSTTALLLKKGALKTIAAAAPCFLATRPTQFNVYKGRITTNTANAVVIGANTKFASSGPGGSGSVFLTNTVSNVFRYADGAFIGAITSVQNDTTLTLTANAAIAMTNEEYYISNPAFQLGGSGVPATFLFTAGSVARFADRYWYGCISASDPSIKATNPATDLVAVMPNSIAFTKKNDPECLDFDPSSGDFVTLPTSHNQDRIRGLCATRAGLVVFRSRDTFIITGYSPETFRAIKIADDGISMSLAFKEYTEGVIWAGAKSVWYFDGTRVVDLLKDSVKKFYQRLNRTVDINWPMCMALSNDHILVGYSPATTGFDRTWPVKNGTGTINYVCLVINMLNGAISFFTNLAPTSSFYSDALGTSVIIARGSPSLFNTTGYLLNGSKIFADSSTGADNFDALTMLTTITSGGTIGPSVMFETVKLSLGNAARLKFWKMFLMNYSSDVSMTAMFISTNDTTLEFPNRSTGTAGVVTLPVSSNVGILKRVKFLVRAPQLSVRVYQTSAVSATSQRFKLFWYTVGGKWMRQGRQQ